jgi:DNA-binding transcriptional regulator YiaG
MPVALNLHQPDAVADELRELGARLDGQRVLPAAVREAVRELAEQIGEAREHELPAADPYLLLALKDAAFRAWRGIANDDAAASRREVRIALEQMRQVFRDIAEVRAVDEDVPAKDVVRWLSHALDVPQPRLAELLEISPRQLQRWLSESDAGAPSGDEARRVRIVAQVAQQLRHALSGPGVVSWFSIENPDVGAAPRALLRDPTCTPALVLAARRARSSGAT